jgi:hypothetical protein
LTGWSWLKTSSAEVTTMIGIVVRRSRSARHNANPDNPGIRQSVTTRSGALSVTSARPSAPLLAVTTS